MGQGSAVKFGSN